MRCYISFLVALSLLAGCSTGQKPADPSGARGGHDGHGHGLGAPVEVTTPPLVRMAEFHGHLGPYVVLGYRAGEAAREVLASPGYFDLEAEVVSPLHTPQSCFIDGIQLGSGCTVGKRNLAVAGGEPIGATFRTKGGGAVRIILRSGLPAEIAGWIGKEGVEAAARRVLGLPREAIFDIRPEPGAAHR